MFRLLCIYITIVGVSLTLFSCVSDTVFVPVIDIHKSPAMQETYIVQPGDTLYSIAWAFDLDFRQLVSINNLKPPYHVTVGQQLWLTTPKGKNQKVQKAPSAAKKKKQIKYTVVSKPTLKSTQPKRWQTGRVSSWIRPARGKIVNIFSNKCVSSGKGIEIHGRAGESIKASAKGTVVYSGDGLRSYGNLLLIKHNDEYLSAYAFNQKLLVKAGDKVKQGQRIATMGRDARGMAILYFEIRRFGKPVNPMQYLRS